MALLSIILPILASSLRLDSLIPDDSSAFDQNTSVLKSALQALQPGETLLIPNNTYWVNGGIYTYNLSDVTIQLEGTLKFQDSRSKWPKQSDGTRVLEALYFENCENITLTSSKQYGTLDGNGYEWWGYFNYQIYSENRPRLLRFENSANILIENIFFKDSPYWTTYFHDIDGLEVRFSKIDARWNQNNNHDSQNLGAFNTDGFDIAGKNVWIHDVDVWNQDDCVCVKQIGKNGKRAQCSENMLFENLTASGLGLTIGSIGASKDESCVNNITFRNIYMPNTFKGIYIKSRPDSEGSATISNILYQNITMYQPEQWAIWIGPQQAIYDGACSLAFPTFTDYCPIPSNVYFRNITLRDINIQEPQSSVFNWDNNAGVILSNSTNPMQDITFENVKIDGTVADYICENTDVKSVGSNIPVPCAKSLAFEQLVNVA